MSSTIVGNLAVELGVNDAQLQSGLAQAVIQAQQAGQKMAQAVNQGATKNGGGFAGSAQGLLNISRAIDDVQYGFQGVINNIEGIVTGLGYGAGIAGAATIAAVALNAIVPKLMELAGAKDPMRELADTIKSIGNSGVGGTFAGIASEAKATQAAMEASISVLEKMQAVKMTTPFFAGGPGMAAPAQAVMVGNDPREIFAQRVRVNELAQETARDAFRANQQRQRIAMAGLAENDITSFNQDQIELNKKIFQAAVDKLGGGQQLADAIKGKKLGDSGLYGSFREGDIKATNEVIKLLGLESEKAKVLADDYERITGQAAELSRIENERAKHEKQVFNKQFDEYQNAVNSQDSLFRQRDDIMLQRGRSEILGSAAEVFARNINAGQEDPQLKKLDEINNSIKELGSITGILN